jgi:protein-S-isoprenylcysteine O-methyltransferase Ste14
MSAIPAFDVGVWNAWILIPFIFLTYLPGQIINKEAMSKVNEVCAYEQWSRTEKLLGNSTHVIIIPLTIIYSIFLPLRLGTIWFYVGIPIYFVGLIMNLIAGINIATIPFDNEPITRGIYRFSRHPAYFGGFLIFLGIGIACASWVYLLFAVAWIVMLHISTPAEECSLLKKYGNTYREYMRKTPRWIGIPKS